MKRALLIGRHSAVLRQYVAGGAIIPTQAATKQVCVGSARLSKLDNKPWPLPSSAVVMKRTGDLAGFGTGRCAGAT